MKVRDLISLGHDALDVAAAFLGKKRLELYMYLEEEVDDSLIDRLRDGEPSAYIIGYVDFFDTRIRVDPRVLIPRPETEELMTLIKNPSGRVLDLCCGSGAIGISLKKKYPALDVTLADISGAALDVAKQNALDNKVDVHCVQSNFLESIKETFDIIICNPPYVTESEWEEIATKEYEPRLAFVGGLEFYQKLRREAASFLNEKGRLYLEIGASQGPDVLALFDPYSRRLIKDLSGRDRFLLVIY